MSASHFLASVVNRLISSLVQALVDSVLAIRSFGGTICLVRVSRAVWVPAQQRLAIKQQS